MSLVSGPGRAAGTESSLNLSVERHVDYIKNLDSVRHSYYNHGSSLHDGEDG